MSHKLPAELHFTRAKAGEGQSLALLFAEASSRCGIYWIDFEDGTSYVGQSINALNRLATHQRRWNDFTSVGFAPCEPERLDELEFAAIQYAQQTRGLRNKMLTLNPGGVPDLVVTTSEGEALVLPVLRADRGLIVQNQNPDAHPLKVSASAEHKARAFRTLSAQPEYAELRSTVATLVRGTFPSPERSQAILWTLSAMPSTARQRGFPRLMTLNAGRLEILYVGERASDSVENWVHLNLDPLVDRRRLRKALRAVKLPRWNTEYSNIEHSNAGQPSARVTVAVPNLQTLQALLLDPFILDSVYALVVRMMRQGLNPLRHNHNWELAADVLATARAQQYPTS